MMNRYRRSARKSAPEPALKGDDAIYFVCDGKEETVKKPNIIARKNGSSSKRQAGQELKVTKDSVQVEKAPELNGQGALYPSEDGGGGSLPGVDAQCLANISDNNGTYSESQTYTTQETLMTPPSCLADSKINGTSTVPSMDLQNGDNENPESGQVLQEASSSPETLNGIHPDVEESNNSDLGSNIQQIPSDALQFNAESSQDSSSKTENLSDQYVLLLVGNKSIYVPGSTYQEYCNAQQSGDTSSTLSFLSQIELALGVTGNDDRTTNETFSSDSPRVSDDIHKVDVGDMNGEKIKSEPPDDLQVEEDTPSTSDSSVALPKEDSEVMGEGPIGDSGITGPADGTKDSSPVENPGTSEDLTSLIKSPPKKPSTSSPSKKNYNINIFRCGTCATLFATKELCLEHIYAVHKVVPNRNQKEAADDKALQCDSCSVTFDTEKELEDHQVTHEAENSTKPQLLPDLPNDSNQSSSTTSCGLDDKKASDETDPIARKSLNFPVNFDCDICGKTLASLYYYLIHGLVHIDGCKGWPCEICSRIFPSKQEVTEHFRGHCQGDLKAEEDSDTDQVKIGSPSRLMDSSKETDKPDERSTRARRRRKSPLRANLSEETSDVEIKGTTTTTSKPPKGKAGGASNAINEPAPVKLESIESPESYSHASRRQTRTNRRKVSPEIPSNNTSKAPSTNEKSPIVRRATRNRINLKAEKPPSGDTKSSSRVSNGPKQRGKTPAAAAVPTAPDIPQRTRRRSLRTEGKNSEVTTTTESTRRPTTNPDKRSSTSELRKKAKVQVKSEDESGPQEDHHHPEDRTGRRGSKRRIVEATQEAQAEAHQVLVKQSRKSRKSLTTTRQILPEDGPQFETGAGSGAARKVSGKGKQEKVDCSSPEDMARVRKSFVNIFNMVKSSTSGK